MAKTIASIRIKDFGEYHNTLIKFYLEKEYEGEELVNETVFVQYGFYNRDSNYLPCTALYQNNKVYVQKAGVGRLGDLKLDPKEWLKVLKVIGSKILFNQWIESVNIKQLVA
jgi:hypothetical protein